MVSPKCFSVNPKEAACGIKSYKERWFSKKVLKPFYHTFAAVTKEMLDRFITSVTKRALRSFRHTQKRAFRLNKAYYLKPYIGSSTYRDQKLQCVEEYKNTSNQVRSH